MSVHARADIPARGLPQADALAFQASLGIAGVPAKRGRPKRPAQPQPDTDEETEDEGLTQLGYGLGLPYGVQHATPHHPHRLVPVMQHGGCSALRCLAACLALSCFASCASWLQGQAWKYSCPGGCVYLMQSRHPM